MKQEIPMNRRIFVKRSLQLCAGLALSSPLSSFASLPDEKVLSFYHTHTRERFQFDCSTQGNTFTLPDDLNVFLRDFRTGDVHSIDPKLVNILYSIQQICGNRGDIEIISGYRSAKTNRLLRNRSAGVAKKSYHMQGRALDVRLTGLKSSTLRDIAISLHQGGVGYYSQSNFVHIDTGRVRSW